MFSSVPLHSEPKERSGTELKLWRLVPVLVRGDDHWFFDPVLIPAVFILYFICGMQDRPEIEPRTGLGTRTGGY
jgi:hypothetical protein